MALCDVSPPERLFFGAALLQCLARHQKGAGTIVGLGRTAQMELPPADEPSRRRTLRTLWRAVGAGAVSGAIVAGSTAEVLRMQDLRLASIYVGAIGGAVIGALIVRVRRRGASKR